MYVHHVEACERVDEEGPGRRANPDCHRVTVAVQDADFQTDPVAGDVSELWEGLYGDIDGLLEGSFKFNQRWRRWVRRKE